MRILFVTRKFPPSTGGMETAAYELYTALRATNDVTLVRWGGSNKLLPVIYVWLLVYALVRGLRHRPDVIYLQDGIMAPLGFIGRVVLRCPTVMTIHGMEATYNNPLYKLMVTPFIGRQTQLVAVSSETRQKIQRSLPQLDPIVIVNGLSDNFYDPTPTEAQQTVIAKAIDMPLEDLQRRKLIHTNGRLVRRKGVRWFIEQVLPDLPNNTLYLVSGTGKEQTAIEAAIQGRQLEDRVRLLGRVSDDVLRALYNTADIFVMPNIPVLHDMEGFGLVALEAASCGTLVVASKLEGIQNAIIANQNGILIEPNDSEAWIKMMRRELTAPSLKPAAVREYTLSHFSWSETAHAYEALMRQMVD